MSSSSFNSQGGSFSHCCKGCTKRFVGCHSTCKDYKDAKEDNEKRKQWERDNETPYLRPIDFNRFGYGKTVRSKKYHKK